MHSKMTRFEKAHCYYGPRCDHPFQIDCTRCYVWAIEDKVESDRLKAETKNKKEHR